jgi:hypothetical protein
MKLELDQGEQKLMHEKNRSFGATVACLLAYTALSPALADPVSVLKEIRPIGGARNNLTNPNLNVVPGSPEFALARLNFAAGPSNSGAHGQNAETTDPVLSVWLYVFGQFVDHDLDLESTPAPPPAINIVVPPNDPVFKSGTSIAMTLDLRSQSPIPSSTPWQAISISRSCTARPWRLPIAYAIPMAH